MPSRMRPRRNIRVACEHCRIARVRCDGSRPSCLRCVQRSLSCVYETNTSDETRREIFRRGQRVRDQLLADIRSSLEVLRHASDEEAVGVLRHIRSSQDSLGALAAISTHRQLLPAPLIARSLNSATESDAILPFQYELMMQHPQVYPIVSPLVHVDGDLSALEPSHVKMIMANSNGPTEELSDVHFDYWTKVPIENDEAAQVILHYLETDHPILGLFDAELFLRSLKERGGPFCSEFLVNSLLFWACLSCSSILETARLHKQRFYQETRQCWEKLKNVDDVTTVVASQMFSLACACEGEDVYAQELKIDGYEMGKRLGIFESRRDRTVGLTDPPDVYRWNAHAAWGVYNWLSLHAFHYRQSPIGEPPSLPIPGDVDATTGNALTDPSSPFMVSTITSLSKFWRILHPIIELWMPDKHHCPLAQRFTLATAEDTFQKLLAWSDENLLETSSTEPVCRPHHVLVLHMWFHTATMEIFRPFYGKHSNLRTFGSRGSTTEIVFWSSLTQLERLALEYRQNHPSASSSIFWHLSLLFIGNAVIRNPSSSSWRFNFLLCMYGYADLAGSFNVANGFLRAILYMAIQNKLCQPAEARAIMRRLPEFNGIDPNNANGSMSRITSSHVVDLEQALDDHSVSQITDLAAKLDDALMFDDFIADPENRYVNGENPHDDTNNLSTTSAAISE